MTEMTAVIFRSYVTKNRGVVVKREPIALFPELPGTNDPYTCSFYMHVGQHSSCDPLWVIETTKPATLEEQNILKEELESIGYKLKVYRRYSKNMAAKRITNLLN